MRIWAILDRLRLYGLIGRLGFDFRVGGELLTDRPCSFAGVKSTMLKAIFVDYVTHFTWYVDYELNTGLVVAFGGKSKWGSHTTMGFDMISLYLSCLFLLNAEAVVGHNLTCTRYKIIGITTII